MRGPGRDPLRIPLVIATLRRVWEQQPDTRLGQLVVNHVPPGCPAYAAEDGELYAALRRTLDRSARADADVPEPPPTSNDTTRRGGRGAKAEWGVLLFTESDAALLVGVAAGVAYSHWFGSGHAVVFAVACAAFVVALAAFRSRRTAR